ncbi:MAG: PAS domain S-box protein, partial [Candidatus Omnitrophica bacterium]|nr:PAS domain S-box protein [Candidatus Omnitrophota bacterium]
MEDKKRSGESNIEALLEYADSIIATLREPFLVLDRSLRIISANQAFYATFKVNEKDTIGQLLPDLGDRQWNVPKLIELLKEIVSGKKVVNDYEVRHKFEHIGERVMLLNARHLRLPKEAAAIMAPEVGGEELILLAIEDVTERKRLQAELKESEERYRRAFETSRDGLLLIHKTEGSILNSNESIRELLGYSHEELMEKKLWEIGSVKDHKDFQKMVKKLETDGVVHYEETPVKTQKGLSINTEIILVNKAKVLQCNIRDITERRRTEGELTQAKEQQYRTLIENLPGKVFLKDRNSTYISCNENYAKDLKIRPEEIAGKTDYAFFPTHLAEKYRADDKRVMKSGETENLEEEYIIIGDYLNEAKRAVINTVKVPVRDKAGNVTGLFGLFWDITERKKAEEALRVSEKKIHAIFDQTFQFIGMMTTDGRLIEANRTAMQFAGIKESDCIGRFFWDTPWWTHSKEMQDKLRDAVIKAALGESVFFEATHLAADKSVHYIDFSLKPVRDQDGKVIFLIPEGRDITERKKAEEALRESESEFRTIVEGSNDGIIFCETETRKIIFANDAMTRLLGRSKEEIVTMTIQDLHHKDDWGSVRREFERHVSGEISTSANIPVVRRDGGIFFADITSSNLDIKGKRHFVAFFRDITERKKIETEREVAIRRQQAVNALQQSLLAPAALEHKLRAITASIVRIFKADFCRIWLIRPGDMCEKGCIHAAVKEGSHVCRYRDKCLHLISSSGRYTRIDGKSHARVPFGCYKIGRVASGEEHRFLTNDVINDPRVHDHEWARHLGLVSFAGYQLKVPGGETMGVLALFAKRPITPAEDAILDSLSVTAAFITQQAAANEEMIQARAMKTSAEMKTDFTGMVSHELRTPLTAIKEGVSVVLDKTTGDINEEQAKY